MNAASQLLRVLAIIGAIAAGVLFWLTHGKLDSLTAQLASAKQSAEADKQNTAKTLADAQAQVSGAVDSIKAQSEKLKTAQDDAKLADQRFSDLRDQLDSLQKSVTDKDRQVKDDDAKVADLQSQVDGMADLKKQVSDLQDQLAKDNVTITNLQNSLSSTAIPNGKPSTTTTANTDISAPVVITVPKNLSKSSPAKILLVDTKNWLMALDVGSDAGVQKDSQLYLKVGDSNLAIVKVLDTTPTQSSVAILSTEDVAPNKFSSIATKGLEVGYQTEVQQ